MAGIRAGRAALIALMLTLSLAAAGTSGDVKDVSAQSQHDDAPSTLRVCFLTSKGVTESTIVRLARRVNAAFASYHLTIEAIPAGHLSAGTAQQYFDALGNLELLPPCDRLVAFVDWSARDIVPMLVKHDVDTHLDAQTGTRAVVMTSIKSYDEVIDDPAKN
jgi:hypothetical protein